MFKAVESPLLAPFNGNFDVAEFANTPESGAPSKKQLRTMLSDLTRELDEQQRMLYAQDVNAVLLIFQAMDAAGKDGTIRAVTKRIDPAGCRVASFKAPSTLERDHDFLWRTVRELPGRGTIGIFNRSYYEEVLVVRVHPEFLAGQRIDVPDPVDALWPERFESIRDHELHLARSGTVVVKFWLNVSREEQRRRFLSRLSEPEKQWKFSMRDVDESGHWNAYMEAYQEAIAATSRPWAPWYVIPADNKPYMRVKVAEILLASLKSLGLTYPEVSADRAAELEAIHAKLSSHS